ncbi:MAG TPA: CHAT domain-containing tetratricopeptide repeat protein [Blastocatellia bacterium]|nr:CHAT domain-containing tetratricopeptide repeat protein [Blastocatellia bacterium]
MKNGLAARLAAADDAEQKNLLEQNSTLLDVELAHSLKSLFDHAKHGDPALRRGAASGLDALARATGEPEIVALATWTGGIVQLQIDGQAEQAISKLDEAASRFAGIGKPLFAAATQVNKIHALLILGRYKDALECGLEARDVLLAHKDELRAGQVEQNLGNIYFRRDRYQQAEEFYRLARERFLSTGDQKQIAEIEVCLATALIFQHRFRDAELLYGQALERSKGAGLLIAQAVIECDLGCLALFRGRYDQALDYLERSRRRYAALGMAHESAIAEQEQAEAYLELNLAPEAAEIYSRIIPTFAEFGMRAEQARSLLYHGRASLLLNRFKEARRLLNDARQLYAAERNAIGEAMVRHVEAQLFYNEGDYEAAGEAARQAEGSLAEAGTWSRSLMTRWLRGEAARALGRTEAARDLFDSTLRDAEAQALPQISQRCYTSLGLLDEKSGDTESAEASFKRAGSLIEELRALLPSDEFRTAFVTDKLTPYTELVRLCLSDAEAGRVIEALGYVERGRSRTLADMLGGAVRFKLKPRDEFEADLLTRLEELREELNWFYSQINRPPDAQAPRSAAALTALRGEVREREGKMLEIMRQLQQRGQNQLTRVEPLDIAGLQRDLGPDTALVEYFGLDDEVLAFVITDEGVEVIRHLGRESDIQAEVNGLRFQINSMRFNMHFLRDHVDQLTLRARQHLSALYDMLLRRVEERLGNRRLVIAPFRTLHYIPFQALYDGRGYAIERREICYTPGAAVLRHCLARPERPLRRAVLLGAADELAPSVRDEVEALAPLFPESVKLTGDEATIAALYEHASSADALHLACHGQFRSDNPLFSSLRLADGWLTVGDAYKLDLNCRLVTLSACETGMSAVAPGEEIIGLARGFFSAGATSLLVSLWTVNDEETASLMITFYEKLLAGQPPAAALRQAQLKMLDGHPHPFFWAPFVLLGRW